MTYDATGQQIKSSATLTNTYDGDRLRAKKEEGTVPTYYLRSSVLGGQVVGEIGADGVFQRGYVYAGSQMVAIQGAGNGQVSWVHQSSLSEDISGEVTMNYTRCILLLALLTLLLFPFRTNAQGMCIPTPVGVKRVKGQIFFSHGGNRRPLQDVTVEVINRNKLGGVIASTVTDARGHFHLEGISTGRYWLKTRHSQVIGIEVELKVTASGKNNKPCNCDRLIVFVLGADPSKPCGGGDVQVVRQ